MHWRLAALLRKYARVEKRSGYWRAYCHLRRQGYAINHKRVQRLWRKAHLQVPVRKRRRRRRHVGPSAVPLRAEHPRHVITYDFLEDSTAEGRPLRLLTIVDEFTRECLAIQVARSFSAEEVVAVLLQVFTDYGQPAFIRSDNGPEFIAHALCAWIYAHGVDTHHIDPGSPWQNGYDSCCTSMEGFGMIWFGWGRVLSLRPCCLVGVVSPVGSSYKHSGLSV